MTPIHPKVLAQASGSVLTGAIATIIVWVCGLRGIAIDVPTATAFATVIAVLGGFVAGYLTPSPAPSTKGP